MTPDSAREKKCGCDNPEYEQIKRCFHCSSAWTVGPWPSVTRSEIEEYTTTGWATDKLIALLRSKGVEVKE